MNIYHVNRDGIFILFVYLNILQLSSCIKVNEELSRFFTDLYNADENAAEVGKDYQLNIQGNVAKGMESQDNAPMRCSNQHIQSSLPCWTTTFLKLV
ncbi:unnamed protein product [Heterobilharzia americana]|nr:unnamed protein product [Heterobilharzia americana]